MQERGKEQGGKRAEEIADNGETKPVGKKVEQQGGKKMEEGLGGKESACQRRRHGSDPWSGGVPPATEQLARAPQL